MVQEIMKVRRYFKILNSTVSDFLQIKALNVDSDNFDTDFSGYKQQFEIIETTWCECISYCTGLFYAHPKLKSTLKVQFKTFCSHILTTFYEGYQMNFESGMPFYIEPKNLLLSQKNSELYRSDGFEDYKDALFYLLDIYWNEVEELTSNDLKFSSPIIPISESVEITKHHRNRSEQSPANLEDLFNNKNDWRKNVDALTETKPALLSKDWKFQGENVKGGKTSLLNWFEWLRKINVVNTNYTRQQIVPVLANAFAMNIGADGSSMQNECDAFKIKFKRQLVQIANIQPPSIWQGKVAQGG